MDKWGNWCNLQQYHLTVTILIYNLSLSILHRRICIKIIAQSLRKSHLMKSKRYHHFLQLGIFFFLVISFYHIRSTSFSQSNQLIYLPMLLSILSYYPMGFSIKAIYFLPHHIHLICYKHDPKQFQD